MSFDEASTTIERAAIEVLSEAIERGGPRLKDLLNKMEAHLLLTSWVESGETMETFARRRAMSVPTFKRHLDVLGKGRSEFGKDIARRHLGNAIHNRLVVAPQGLSLTELRTKLEGAREATAARIQHVALAEGLRYLAAREAIAHDMVSNRYRATGPTHVVVTLDTPQQKIEEAAYTAKIFLRGAREHVRSCCTGQEGTARVVRIDARICSKHREAFNEAVLAAMVPVLQEYELLARDDPSEPAHDVSVALCFVHS